MSGSVQSGWASSSPEDSLQWWEHRGIAFSCTIAVPVLTSFVYIIDKVAIAGRVKHTQSYVALIGIVDTTLGLTAQIRNTYPLLIVFLSAVILKEVLGVLGVNPGPVIHEAIRRWRLQGMVHPEVIEDSVPVSLSNCPLGTVAVSDARELQKLHQLQQLQRQQLQQMQHPTERPGLRRTLSGSTKKPGLVRTSTTLAFPNVVPERAPPTTKAGHVRSFSGSNRTKSSMKLDSLEKKMRERQLGSAKQTGLSTVLIVPNKDPSATPVTKSPSTDSVGPSASVAIPPLLVPPPDTPRDGRTKEMGSTPKDAELKKNEDKANCESQENDRKPQSTAMPNSPPSTRERPPEIEKPKKVHKLKKGQRKYRNQRKTMLLMVPLVLTLGGSEFMTKLSTDNLHPIAVSGISYATYGLVFVGILVLPHARKFFVEEFKMNWYWPIISESFMILSYLALTVAMSNLPAAIVSSIASASPLFVLLMEFIFRIAEDTWFTFFAYKLVPIVITVIGVAILSLEVEF
eukprot:m51a1_g749 hypothetical protein (514) ;mRNA; r:518052-519896